MQADRPRVPRTDRRTPGGATAIYLPVEHSTLTHLSALLAIGRPIIVGPVVSELSSFIILFVYRA
jgi:hypothetical protein